MSRISSRAIGLSAVVLTVVIGACAGTTDPAATSAASGNSLEPSFAKAIAGPNVTATNPSYGHDGQVGESVTISGSGFAPGAQASWEQNGVTDPNIQVTSTTYISSTQLVATITIAANATIGLYDVAVTNADRKKGIGYSLFEVTTATLLSGTETAYDVNSNGEIAGRVGVPGAYYYSPVSGLDTLGSPGRAYAISADGKTVAGGTTNNALNANAYVWENAGGLWQKTKLPKNPAACISTAMAIGSDINGAAAFVGGVENNGCYNQTNLHRQPKMWVPSGGTWIGYVLPGGVNTDDMLDDVNGSGTAVGMSSNKAAVWTPSGAGTWVLSSVGPNGSSLHGINGAGTIAVGDLNGIAEYWTNNGSTWSGPFALPGSCTSAVSVDDAGEILANGCTNGSRQMPVVISSPYGTGNVRFLSGLGNGKTITAEKVSPNGEWAVGEVAAQNATVGVYWKLF
jgi:IPT/TIG domain.